ncbi:MAG TPA: 4Fe-4S dicluster domain-containing protein, partial [Chloroflexi bacterium]|nr:4Fe-4S dicluster domain-containing protein [Chloroflexota bacterium]
RPFCRWVCPLGALWSPFNPWSTFRLAVDESRCIQCERCFQVCPVEIHVYQEPNSGACIRCMRCVQACPVSCITVTSPGWSLESDRNVEQV